MNQSGFNSEFELPQGVKPNSNFLTTVQYAKFVDLVSEGEIEGFKSANDTEYMKGTYNYNLAALKDVFFDNTPIIKENADLSVLDDDDLIDLQDKDFNFNGVGFNFREGRSNSTISVSASNLSYTQANESTKCTFTSTDANFALDKGDVVRVNFSAGSGSITGVKNFKVIESNNVNTFSIKRPVASGTLSGTAQANTTAITHIPDTEQVETPVSNAAFGSVILHQNPVSIQVPHDANNPIDAVRVQIGADAFFKGNGKKVKVNYRIQIVQNDGTETDVFDSQFNNSLVQPSKAAFKNLIILGKTTKKFTRDHLIQIPSTYSFPIQIKISRLTKDRKPSVADKIKFEGMFTVINEKQTYPTFAHTFLRLNSQQFKRVPKRIYKLRGIKVKIPTIGTVNNETGAISYPDPSVTPFNGVLTTAKTWTSDPAWILYELLTNSTFGLGDYISESQLDVYSFQEASKYCGTLVENLESKNVKEPRFSINATLNTREDAYKVIKDICSVFRAIPFYTEGAININQDRPQQLPDYIFNRSNVTEEGFNYVGTDLRERATRVSVSYFNPETLKNDVEQVSLQDLFGSSTDTTAKESLGEIHEKFTAFGCTSRGQAIRAARMLLFEEQRSTQTVNFQTTLEAGVKLRPGSLIEIQDPLKAGLRRGGRIVSATSSSITIDDTDSTDIPSSGTRTLSVLLKDGTVESGTIDTISGATINVNNITRADETTGNSTFTTVPNANSVFTIEDSSVENQSFRVISVSEDKNLYAISAISYHASKYDFVEGIINELPIHKTTILNESLEPPKGLTLTEINYIENGQPKNKIDIQWQPVVGAASYTVEYDSPAIDVQEVITQGTSFEILDAEQSLSGDADLDQNEVGYDIKVYANKGDGQKSNVPSSATFQVLGKQTPPDDITGLTVEPVDKNFVKLHWNKSTDAYVLNGGSIYVKHTNLTSGGNFQNSSPIIDAVPGNSTEVIVPKISGTYVIRAKDSNNRFSNNEQTIQFTLDDSDADDQDTITNINEDSASFAGTKTGVAITSDGTGLEMILAGDGLFDDETDFDTLTPNLDQIGDTISTTGTYEFTTTGDLGANNKMPTHFIKNIAATTFLKNTQIDTRNNIDLFSDIDGTKVDEPKVDLFVASTDDDPSSGSPTFTAFEKFSNATFKGRGYKFKAVFTSTKPDENIKVTTLRATGSLAPRTETQRDGTCVHTVNGDFVSSASAGTITVTPTTADITGAIVGTDILNGDTVNLTFTTSTLTGTYIATGGTTTIICNFTAHGFSAGDPVILDFTSGSATDGTYTVSASGLSTDRFFVTSATSLDTSGNVTLTIAKPDDGTYTVASVSGTTSFTVNDADAPLVTKSGQQCVTKKTMTPDNSGFIRSGAFGVTCTFAKRFKTPPTVNVFLGEASAQDLFFKPVAVTETEFTIRFGDAGASNLLKSLLFSYTATGFGKGDTS